ncbi:MAG: hypothetical protein MK098_12450 [Marinovum sp.]|nr:hypothetical protein [Marinovum sp.]
MANIVVTDSNWNDANFWNNLTITQSDTLDLTALYDDFSITLLSGELTIKETDTGADYSVSSIVSGNVDDFLNVLLPQEAPENLLVNGSFEGSHVADNRWGQAKLDGWYSNFSKIEVWKGGFLGVDTKDGGNLIELDLHRHTVDKISQYVTTDEGETYTLNFAAQARNSWRSVGESLEIFWNGELIDTVAPDTGDWTTFSYTVTGTGGRDKLTFGELENENDGYGILMDAISLTSETSGDEMLVNGSFEGNNVAHWSSVVVEGWFSENNRIEVWGEDFLNHGGTGDIIEIDLHRGHVDEISQDVQTTDGATYEISFNAQARNNWRSDGESLVIYWNGEVIDTIQPPRGQWETYTYTVTGTGGMDTITFGELEDEDDSYGILLDEVSMIETSRPGGGTENTFALTDESEAQTIIGGEDSENGEDLDTIDLSAVSSGVSMTFTDDEEGSFNIGQTVIQFKEIEQFILTDGDDTVDATEGKAGEIIDFGAGSDSIENGAGSDTYVYGLGDGNKTIHDQSYFLSDVDKLVFTDLNLADMTITQSTGEDMVITLSDGATITVIDHFDKIIEMIEELHFADGTVLNRQGILDKAVADQKADGATILGSDFGETYIHTTSDGSYTIEDYSLDPNEIDRLVLSNETVYSVTFSQNAGRDLVISLSSGETITITDHFNNAYEDMEEIAFGDGVVLDAKEIRNKAVADQKGQTTITGSAESEDYFHTLGDGSYTIEDRGTGLNAVDRLFFTDETADAVNFSQNAGRDLVLTLSNGETITVRDHFDLGSEGMEEIIFGDNTVMDAEAIQIRVLTDQIEDGGTVFGTTRADTFYHANGVGSYTINDRSFDASAEDRLVLIDETEDGVTLSQNAGQDLIITTSTGETITVKDHFRDTSYDLEVIEFSDGTTMSGKEIRDRSVADQVAGGEELIRGSALEETYTHTKGDGSYTVRDLSYISGEQDIFIFNDVNADEVTVSLSESDNDDVVITLENGDMVTFDEQTRMFYGVEEVQFADGTRWTADELITYATADDAVL